jgi:F-type H+-transporting ATPase subunit delta
MNETSNENEFIGDVGARRVAGVYAEALLNAATKQGQGDAVFEELDSLVSDVFPTYPEFAVLLSSAAAGRKARGQILERVFAGRASELFYNFLLVLNDNDRLDLLPAIRATYRELHDKRAGRVRVQVRSAVALPDDQRERLTQRIRDSFHIEPILETGIDPGLLGGLYVKIGDMLYDASVRAQLENIRSEIIARSSHEIQSQRDRFCSANGN